ncbi:MAG TPA: hypothetical protein PLK75_03890, partial [Bacteroidales bacterium]|nr:hypothetical protein [Bacteroidales bacterium]
MSKPLFRNTFILLFFQLSCIFSFSQGVKNIDGLYYTDKNELYTGDYIELYDNGNIKLKMHIENGQKEGETMLYFQNGSVSEARNYHKGKKHGDWVCYDTSGVKIAVAQYENNQKSGLWLIWDANGILR